MKVTITIDNANAVSAGVTSSLDAKKAEIVAQLVAGGTDPVDAASQADAQMAAVTTLAQYVFFSGTKCVLVLDSDTNGIAVIGDDILGN